MTCFDFTRPDGETIVVFKWLPASGPPRAAVQISHGMAEHAGRYERFAEKLASEGFAVYANDHRGHGRTARTHDRAGTIAGKNGFSILIEDMHALTEIIRTEQGNIPLFLFGHSMGSFLAQGYISRYDRELSGVILSGSAGSRRLVAFAGSVIAGTLSLVFGSRKRIRLLDRLVFGAFNRQFRPARTPFDWLSRDAREVDWYVFDHWCGFLCTAGFFHDFLSGLVRIHSPFMVRRIPKTLPVLVISGSDDPVGGNGRFVRRLVRMYEKHGIADLEWKLYDGARHELLNEVNREEVSGDIISWLNRHLAEA